MDREGTATRAMGCRQPRLDGPLKIIQSYTFLSPFSDEGIGTQRCSTWRNFPRREQSGCQGLEAEGAGLCKGCNRCLQVRLYPEGGGSHWKVLSRAMVPSDVPSTKGPGRKPTIPCFPIPAGLALCWMATSYSLVGAENPVNGLSSFSYPTSSPSTVLWLFLQNI